MYGMSSAREGLSDAMLTVPKGREESEREKRVEKESEGREMKKQVGEMN